MRREITGNCSPYLCRPTRSLPEVCRDITRRHRADPPPCEACPLADLCDRRSGKRDLAEPRPRALDARADGLALGPNRPSSPNHPGPGQRSPARGPAVWTGFRKLA